MLEALYVPAAVVAVAEIGDKTQLLAIILAARFRRPWPIVGGILVATLANHAVAAWIGETAAGLLQGAWFQTAVGAAFLVMGLWALVPDKPGDPGLASNSRGVFLTTLVAFFLVEIGDKTQIATSLLAAKYQNLLLVTLGTTAGMMAANVPAVVLGEAVTKRVPLRLIRIAAAVLFAALGAWVLWTVARSAAPLP